MALDAVYSVSFCSGVRKGAGASSTSFWWRRCSEQSRVETTTTLPAASARHCVSTWRGLSRYFSTKHSPRPKAEIASRVADSNCSGTSSTVRATLRPRPPPPYAALIAIGRPCSSTNSSTSVGPLDRTRRAGREGRADLLGDVTGGHLVAEGLDRVRARADPDESRRDDGAGEVGVLGEEAVPGVHGVGAGRGGRPRGSCRSTGRCRRSSCPRGRTPRRRGARGARRGPGRRRRRPRLCPSRAPHG